MSPSNSKTMAFPFGETSSDSQVPSSVVNSILRVGFSDSPFFSSFFSSFLSSFLSLSCAAVRPFGPSARAVALQLPERSANPTNHTTHPPTVVHFAFMLDPPTLPVFASLDETRWLHARMHQRSNPRVSQP